MLDAEIGCMHSSWNSYACCYTCFRHMLMCTWAGWCSFFLKVVLLRFTYIGTKPCPDKTVELQIALRFRLTYWLDRPFLMSIGLAPDWMEIIPHRLRMCTYVVRLHVHVQNMYLHIDAKFAWWHTLLLLVPNALPRLFAGTTPFSAIIHILFGC